MVSIKLKAGVFFWQHKVIRAGDPAFEVDEATAIRLVDEKGVAEYASPFSVEQTDEEPKTEEAITEETEVEQPDEEKPRDLEELTAKELRELGKQYGLTFKGNASKAEMIDAITEEQIAYGVHEDAPTFDAAEAVQ